MTSTRFIPFLLLPLLACETSPEGARRMKITAEAETFVYEVSAARTHEIARELLAEKGHLLRPGPLVMDQDLASDWQKDGSRFLVRFVTVEPGRYMVHIVGQSRNREGVIVSRMRWHDLEWELIQRAEPARAVAIGIAATRQADDIHRRNARR